MRVGDKVRLSAHGEGIGVIYKIYDDGSNERGIKFPSGEDYVVPEASLELVEAAPVDIKSPTRERRRVTRWSPESKYRIGHNMRPYLAQAIYEEHPEWRGLFTEKEKNNYEELQTARTWLIDHPAFLKTIEVFVVNRGIDTDNPINIQLFVELYRWDETLQSIVSALQNSSVVAARQDQEAAWREKEGSATQVSQAV